MPCDIYYFTTRKLFPYFEMLTVTWEGVVWYSAFDKCCRNYLVNVYVCLNFVCVIHKLPLFLPLATDI